MWTERRSDANEPFLIFSPWCPSDRVQHRLLALWARTSDNDHADWTGGDSWLCGLTGCVTSGCQSCVSVDGHWTVSQQDYGWRDNPDNGRTLSTLCTYHRYQTYHRHCICWLCSMWVVITSSVRSMPYVRFFNKCRAKWVRQGTRRLKLALKSLKCLFRCSYFCCSYFIIIIIIIIIINKPRIFYTCYVALENSKTFSQ